MIKQPTHKDGHLLDLGITDMIEVESATVLPRVADHNVIRFVMNLEVPHQHPRGRRVYEYNQTPWHVIRADLAARDLSWIRTSSVHDAAHRFNTEILQIIEARVPSKIIFDKAAVHPWYNDHCRELIQSKRAAEGTPEYESAVTKCSRGIFSEYLKFVKRTREKLKTLRRGSKQVWRLSTQLMDKSAASSGIPALKDGDKWALNAAGKANLLERTFALKCMLQPIEMNEYSGLDAPLLTGGFLRIRYRDVLRVLRNLKEHRATGPDLLATCVLNAFA